MRMDENSLSNTAISSLSRGAFMALGGLQAGVLIAIPLMGEFSLAVLPFMVILLAASITMVAISLNVLDVYIEPDGLRVYSWRKSYRVPLAAIRTVSYHPRSKWGRGGDRIWIRLNDVSIDGGEFTFYSSRADFEELQRLYKNTHVTFELE